MGFGLAGFGIMGTSKNLAGRSGTAHLRVVSEPRLTTDAPAPASAEPNPDPTTVDQLAAQLVDGIVEVGDLDDPLAAEMLGATLAAMLLQTGEEKLGSVAGMLVPAIEAIGSREALALLCALGALADEQAEPLIEAARQAAARLLAGGMATPAFARSLGEPLVAGPFSRLHDADLSLTVLIGVFHRDQQGHALIITVDHEDCGAAASIALVDLESLPTVIAGIHQEFRANGVPLRTGKLSESAFHWYAEQALKARAVHDLEDDPEDDVDDSGLVDLGLGVDLDLLDLDDEDLDDEDLDDLDDEDLDDEDEPSYAAYAVLTRSRLAGLAPAKRPRDAPAPAHSQEQSGLDVLREFAALILAEGGLDGGLVGLPGPSLPELPPRRAAKDGPAPVYQLKVGIRGAKPPIWRRLLVPGDTELTELHRMIQAAFGWDGTHLHVFETEYGSFGREDPELGHTSDASATLEQVVSQVKDKFTYTYDFGDDWEHQILVEKIEPADPSMTYPVCTGGRRAAPPDDCGGIWGYHELVEVMADPSHPDHQERLAWLGLDDAAGFQPARFDAEEISELLREC